MCICYSCENVRVFKQINTMNSVLQNLFVSVWTYSLIEKIHYATGT